MFSPKRLISSDWYPASGNFCRLQRFLSAKNQSGKGDNVGFRFRNRWAVALQSSYVSPVELGALLVPARVFLSFRLEFESYVEENLSR